MNNLLDPRQITQRTIRVSILSGPDKGLVYKINGSIATIGRADGNNIVIKDPKISRNQLGLRVSENKIYIDSLSEKNLLVYENTKIKSLVIIEKETFKIGNTSLKIEFISIAPATKTYAFLQKKKKVSPLFVGLIGAIVLVFFFLSQEKNISDKDLGNRKVTSLENLSNFDKIKEEVLEMKAKKSNKKAHERFKKAHEKYLSGFRDFKNHNFERSTDFFRSCLAIDPGHLLCERYFRLSQSHFSKLIQKAMMLGQKYLEQRQYSQCISAFKNIMYMIKKREDGDYIEASRGLNICMEKKKGIF